MRRAAWPLVLWLSVACAEPPSVAPSATIAAPGATLAGAATPQASTRPSSSPTAAVTWWDAVDPQITLNPVVANAVTSRRVPSGSDSFNYPAHIDLEFGTGYVDVFRLSDLRSDFDTQIASLQSLLKDRVDLRTRYPYYLAGTVGNFRSDPELEAIPRYGARPAFYARPHYVDATLFSGVAYLTQFVRTNAFVNVDQATYVTQGITRDGKYLIDARFATSSSMPTRLPTQPPDWRVPDPAFDLFWINFVREIDFRSDSAFAPSLAHVDAMLQTLRLSAP